MVFSSPVIPWFAAFPDGNASKSRYIAGAARVVRENFTLVDESRITPAYKSFKGLPKRVLNGEIWRPANPDKAGPLLVYSHGFMSSRRESLYLVRFLASHGYTVVGVDYPLTCTRAPARPFVPDIINQPGDISFVLDYVLARNANSADRIHGTINPDKVAAAGVSLGGLTSILASYHSEVRDSRINATISIAGPTTIFSEKMFAGNDTPLLLIYGDGDSLVLHDDHGAGALDKTNDATLVTLKDGSHTGFAQVAAGMFRFLKNPDIIAMLMIKATRHDGPWEFIEALGDETHGIIAPENNAPPRELLVTETMKGPRQHMYTVLAAHAFLESKFAHTATARNKAHNFLHKTMPRENRHEVTVRR